MVLLKELSVVVAVDSIALVVVGNAVEVVGIAVVVVGDTGPVFCVESMVVVVTISMTVKVVWFITAVVVVGLISSVPFSMLVIGDALELLFAGLVNDKLVFSVVSVILVVVTECSSVVGAMVAVEGPGSNTVVPLTVSLLMLSFPHSISSLISL